MVSEIEKSFISVLEEELVLATGCTEPIAIAYCAAKMREILESVPEKIKVEVSGNIIKNAKSAIVPNTEGLKGIACSASAGIIAGDARRQLQVISSVSPEKRAEIMKYVETHPIEVACLDSKIPLDIRITGFYNGNYATVRISNSHSNIVFIEKNGVVLKSENIPDNPDDNLTDKHFMTIRNIFEFADTVDLTKIKELISRQVEMNFAIAEEGIRNPWGANIGKLLLKTGKDIRTEAKAYAAAGSDARMSGCEMPVVIVSGSGNQGITASVPVVCYARKMKVSEEKMLRAIILSDLITIHQKTGIGRLSAYCGAISAGCGAGAGIAYLHGARYNQIAQTVTNAIVILSGTVCDGAKPSCAAKIASSVEAGIIGYEMSKANQHFNNGDGLVSADVEKTISNVWRLAYEGMKQTDRTIQSIMTA